MDYISGRRRLAIASLALLTGCSANGSPANAGATQALNAARSWPAISWGGDLRTNAVFRQTGIPVPSGGASRTRFTGRYDARAMHVFLADSALNLVYVFANGRQTGEIGHFREPQGLASDASGTLYVADTVNNAVKEYRPPYSNPPAATIVDSGKFPVDVAVAPDGVVALLNVCSGPSCSLPGGVDFYAKGNSTAPCASVSGGTSEPTVLFGAFDSKGTLFFGGLNSSETTQIAEIRGECKASSITALTTSNRIAFPSGVQVDTSGNIAIGDTLGPSLTPQVDIYAPLAKASTKLRLLSKAQLTDSSILVSFALTKQGTDLYTAEPHDSLEYAYPGGGSAITFLSPGPSGGDLIEGVAVTPAEMP